MEAPSGQLRPVKPPAVPAPAYRRLRPVRPAAPILTASRQGRNADRGLLRPSSVPKQRHPALHSPITARQAIAGKPNWHEWSTVSNANVDAPTETFRGPVISASAQQAFDHDGDGRITTIESGLRCDAALHYSAPTRPIYVVRDRRPYPSSHFVECLTQAGPEKAGLPRKNGPRPVLARQTGVWAAAGLSRRKCTRNQGELRSAGNKPPMGRLRPHSMC